MFEVDNAGNFNCAFLAFAKGLIWLIQAELARHDSDVPLFTQFLALLEGHIEFKGDPVEAIKQINLHQSVNFLNNVQLILRHALIELYFHQLEVGLQTLAEISDEALPQYITEHKIFRDVMSVVYGKSDLQQNDFFCYKPCRNKIKTFVSFEASELEADAYIAPSIVKKLIFSVFAKKLDLDNEGPSCSLLLDRNAVGAQAIYQKGGEARGTFEDIKTLADYLNVNVLVVNNRMNFLSMENARPHIYLLHHDSDAHNADHWTTVLNAFPYSHCALLSEKIRHLEKYAYSFSVSKKEMMHLFERYIEKNNQWCCFYNTRHHLSLANAIVDQCIDPLKTVEDILHYLITHPPASYGSHGKFAAIANYVCYRQFGMSYQEKIEYQEGYQQLRGEVCPTEQDLMSYTGLSEKSNTPRIEFSYS